MNGTTRLAISGVPSRVALRVAERKGLRATVEQKLPFLAIGTEIADEEGRTGRISRVNVALEGGVPKLVLELAYDVVPIATTTSSRPRRDETISYERPTVPEPLRALRLESADRSHPARPASEREPVALAIPLENRRNPSPATRSWLRWLLAPFSRARD